MSETTEIPAFPRIEATITPTTDGQATGQLVVNGIPMPFDEAAEDDVRRDILASVRVTAEQMKRPVRMTTHDRFGKQTIAVNPSGVTEPLTELDAGDAVAAAPVAEAAPVPASVPYSAPPTVLPAEPAAAAPVTADVPAAPSERRAARQSFLTREEIEEPATRGLRGALARIGIRVAPSEAERLMRSWIRLVSQHWPGPRTIVVVNGKGGAGKTMTTICMSSVFARNGGAGVLAWDNNQTRGTLGWSTEQGAHDASILDLLPQVPRLLGTGAQSADLAHFVHHQTRDRYDVLRSKPEVLATEQRFDAGTVDSIHGVAAKFYRLVFIDSGNDETDPMWVRALERADQIVVPTTGEAKVAESAALLLEGLHDRGGHFAELADKAVVVVSQHKKDLPEADLNRTAAGFKDLARAVVTIPYDKGLGADIINYGALRPDTQRAWLAAGAAVAGGL